MAEFRLTANVVIYAHHVDDNTIWLTRDIVLPFPPTNGLCLMIGEEPGSKAALIEYNVGRLAWDVDIEGFWSLQEVNTYGDDEKDSATPYLEAGWVVDGKAAKPSWEPKVVKNEDA